MSYSIVVNASASDRPRCSISRRMRGGVTVNTSATRVVRVTIYEISRSTPRLSGNLRCCCAAARKRGVSGGDVFYLHSRLLERDGQVV